MKTPGPLHHAIRFGLGLAVVLLLYGCSGGGGGGGNPPPSVTLNSIAITPASASIAVGSSATFTAKGTFSNGTTSDISGSVTWSSSNTTVASIGTSGIATGVAAGNSAISATSGNIVSPGVNLSVSVWTTKTPMTYARDNAANAVLNGKIYVLGGAPAGTSILCSMERYDPGADTWTTMADLPAWTTFAFTPPWGSATNCGSSASSSTVASYRYGPATAPYNGLIYAIGGTSQVSGRGPIYPITVYDPGTNSWSLNVPTTAATTAAGTAGQTLTPFPTGRWGFDVAVIDGLIYAVGGVVNVPGNITKTSAYEVVGTTGNIVAPGGRIIGAAVVNPAGTTITGLSNWKHYYFFVTAIDGSGNESAPSFVVSTLLRSIYATGEGSASENGQATITWMETAGATSYNLYYSTRSGVIPKDASGVLPSGVIKVTGISATTGTVTKTVTGLTNGTPYYFIATAMTPSGEILATNQEISVTPQATPTGVPTGVSVASGDKQITLSWNPVAGASSYNIYYDTGNNIYYGAVEAYDPIANTWTAKAPMPTPRWGSTVSVVNGLIYAIGGWGGWPELAVVEVYDPASNTWSTTVPVNAATVAAGTAGKPLTPMPTARDDMGFSVVNGIIYAIGGDTGTFDDANRIPCCTTVVEAYDPVANTWTTKPPMPTIRDDFDSSLVDGVIYSIAGSRDGKFTNTAGLDPAWLAANDGGFSLTTVEAFATSSLPVPNGVTVAKGANQATVSWNAVTGATSYNLYWSNKAGVATTVNSTKISGVTSPYTHTGLTAGTWYYYVVTAVTATGESLPSNEVAIKP